MKFLLKICLQRKWPGIYILPQFSRGHNQIPKVASNMQRIGQLVHGIYELQRIARFFYKQHFFSTQSQSCLTFSWIQLWMLLRCCLLRITIIMARKIFYLAYSCIHTLYPHSVFAMSWPSSIYIVSMESFFIVILTFIIINHIILLKQTNLFFAHFLEYLKLVLDDNMAEESE